MTATIEMVKVYGEQREVIDTITVDAQEYRLVATGLKRLAYMLIGPRGGIVELHFGIGKGAGYLMPMDKSGRRVLGRTVFAVRDGRVQIAGVVS